MNATHEIASMISSIGAETSQAASRMQTVRSRMDAGLGHIASISDVLARIEERNSHATGVVHDIAAATQEQSSASCSIAQQVEEISRMAESNASSSGHNRTQAIGMKELATRLRQAVTHFKT